MMLIRIWWYAYEAPLHEMSVIRSTTLWLASALYSISELGVERTGDGEYK